VCGPRNQRLFATQLSDQTVAAYDMLTGRIIWRVNTAEKYGLRQPDRLTITVDGRALYVPMNFSREKAGYGGWQNHVFIVLDASTGEKIAEISRPGRPHNSWSGEAGQYMYLGGRSDQTLVVADQKTHRVVKTIPIRRNGHTPGRGGSTYEAFKLEPNWKELPVGKAGVVSSDDYWERITAFLQHVIPVCKQYDVRMAAHPYDPPGLPFGYQGAENWDSPSIFEGFKRYEKVVESPYNGFQLCLRTTGEGLEKPLTDVLPIVQYLGERGKIYQIHMRNIRGGLNDFAEVYPDEGDMDFSKVMRILRDTQFAYSICADHMPSHPDDPGKLQAFAFGNGYIKALIDAVNSEV
jgi:hypothetical protein